jgi:hypothetical protein
VIKIALIKNYKVAAVRRIARDTQLSTVDTTYYNKGMREKYKGRLELRVGR